jgi:hypothetical protein
MKEPEEPDASLPELPRELSPKESDESDREDASLKELLHEDSNESESPLEDADESHGVTVVVVGAGVVVAHWPSRIV